MIQCSASDLAASVLELPRWSDLRRAHRLSHALDRYAAPAGVVKIIKATRNSSAQSSWIFAVL